MRSAAGSAAGQFRIERAGQHRRGPRGTGILTQPRLLLNVVPRSSFSTSSPSESIPPIDVTSTKETPLPRDLRLPVFGFLRVIFSASPPSAVNLLSFTNFRKYLTYEINSLQASLQTPVLCHANRRHREGTYGHALKSPPTGERAAIHRSNQPRAKPVSRKRHPSRTHAQHLVTATTKR